MGAVECMIRVDLHTAAMMRCTHGVPLLFADGSDDAFVLASVVPLGRRARNVRINAAGCVSSSSVVGHRVSPPDLRGEFASRYAKV